MAPMPHDGKAAEAQITLIRPVVGLVITSTVHSSFGSVEDTAVHTYGVLDTENWYSVTAVSPQEIRYGIRLAAPSDAQADSDARKFKIGRRVRRQDIEQSARMTLFYSTADPDMYAGQTFAETSVKTLGLLKSGSDVPFVLGVVSSEDMFGPDNSLTTAAQGMVAGGKSNGPLSPAHLAGAFAMFSSDRRYYRGPLHRVEPAAVEEHRALRAESARGDLGQQDRAAPEDHDVAPVTEEAGGFLGGRRNERLGRHVAILRANGAPVKQQPWGRFNRC